MQLSGARTMSRKSFGAQSEHVARRCSEQAAVLWCDGTDAPAALAEAVRLRREGVPYLVTPILQDARAISARQAAYIIYRDISDVDQRRAFFESIASGNIRIKDQPIGELQIYDAPLLGTLREFSQMGDGLFLRSQTERQRVEDLLKRKRPFIAIAPLIDESIPLIQASPRAKRIVVWAPDEDAHDLCMYSYALWNLHEPAIFVCRGEVTNSPHRFVTPDRGSEALRAAAVVIDAQLSDPGTAIALAACGYRVAIASTSGAHEYIRGACVYEPHDFLSISAAVSRARGLRSHRVLAYPDAVRTIQETLEDAQPLVSQGEPLVSIVIPTYNRREEIRASLESFARQTYENLEILVVNDCGEDVSDIVDEFPFARYLCTPKNGGSNIAANVGLRQARGEYVGVIADDDRNYPTHVASLVAALTQSSTDVAHANIVLRLETTLADGRIATYGHHLAHDGDYECWRMFAEMDIHAQGYLVRRSAWEQLGFLDETLSYASDLDSLLRFGKHFDFTHVTMVTGEMAYRDDKSNSSGKAGSSLAQEVERVLRAHVPPESELLTQRISYVVDSVDASSKLQSFFQPHLRLEDPIPR